MAEPAPESFPHPENNEPQQEPDALAICDELNDLRIETDGGSSTAGVYAHDELFGTSRLHARLVALGQMRASYKQRFAGGDVREIADFAVTSGHEAVAFFAGRLASYTRVRRSTIPRCRDEFAAARATDNPTAVTTTEIALHRAGEDFAKAVNSALQGWHEHYPWIRRSIEDERIRHQGRVTEHVLEQAAKVRSNDDQLRGQLQSIVNQGSSTPAAACKLWRDLRREGRRFFRIVNGVEVVNFRWCVTARRLYPDMESPMPPELMWAMALKEATQALRPVFKDINLDVMVLHRLVLALEDVLRGEQVQLRNMLGPVEPVVAEAEARLAERRRPPTFRGTSPASVTAIVKAVKKLRAEFPDTALNKKQIKTAAGKKGGAADEALKWALANHLITADYRMTARGEEFLGGQS